MHIIIKIIFNGTYRLIFKIIMNAIKLTILHNFLSVRIKNYARDMLRPGCYPFFFLLDPLPPSILFLLLTLGGSGWRGSFSTYPGLSLETIGETWEKLSFLLVEI